MGLTPHTLSKIFLVQFVSLQIPSSLFFFFIRRALTALKWEVGEAEGVSLFFASTWCRSWPVRTYGRSVLSP